MKRIDKVLIAFAEFKESISSTEASEIGKRVFDSKGFQARAFPIADGGNGTIDALAYHLKGKFKTYRVHSPTGEYVNARVFFASDFAFIEMAEASGLALVPFSLRDPLKLTSYGTGELIKAVMEEGIKKIYLGIGGSATVDGGLGVLSALGFKLIGRDGKEVSPTGEGLIMLKDIEMPKLEKLKGIELYVIADVNNPLLGEKGAVRVFGPQKGLKEEYFEAMEKGLEKLARIIKKKTGRDVSELKGGGAAGGIGAALYGFLGAKIIEGAKFFLSITDFENALKNSDFLITGEGKFDLQSLGGKATGEVISLAQKYSKPFVIFAGSVGKEIDHLPVFSILQKPVDLQLALKTGRINLERALNSFAILLAQF